MSVLLICSLFERCLGMADRFTALLMVAEQLSWPVDATLSYPEG